MSSMPVSGNAEKPDWLSIKLCYRTARHASCITGLHSVPFRAEKCAAVDSKRCSLRASHAENSSTGRRISVAIPTCVHACRHLSSSLPRAAALCAGWSACLPDLWWCLAELAGPSQQPQLGANMLCLDTAALAQNRSRHGKSGQHLLALIQRRCICTKMCLQGTSVVWNCIQRDSHYKAPFLYHLQQLLLGDIRSVLRCLLQFLPELTKLGMLHGQECLISLLTVHSSTRIELIPSRQPWPRLLACPGHHSGHQQ